MLTIAESPTAMPFDALHGEALQQRAGAVRVNESQVEIDAVHGTLRGPRRQQHAVGEHLQHCHEGPMLAWCRELTGLTLFPTLTSYLYFEPTSTLGLHQDVPACTYTAAVLLSGAAPVLHILLGDDERRLPPQRLLALSRAAGGHPALGAPITLHTHRPLLFRGARYAHRLQPFNAPCTLATFCYAPVRPLAQG